MKTITCFICLLISSSIFADDAVPTTDKETGIYTASFPSKTWVDAVRRGDNVTLKITGTEFKNRAGVRVYLCLKDASIKTGIDTPHYVVSFARGEADTPALFDLTESIKRLLNDGKIKDTIDITLISSPFFKNEKLDNYAAKFTKATLVIDKLP